MPVFKRNNGTSVTGEVTLVVGNSLRLKLDGEPKSAATVAHFTLRSDMPDAVTIAQSPDERRREQSVTITANRTAASAVTIRAYHADGN
ncbi:MAG: hypothetical protein LBV45_01785, partial [Xanthomonadaceae bacterium]|nr:hypothetical protein [Xanthomonadaceae bacterium]